jgi:benzoylformate decarboxylase
VGGEFVEESFYAPGPVMPEGVDLVHVDVSPHRVGRNFPATVGLVGDIAAILADLAARVPPAAPARLEVLRSRKSEELQRHRDTVRADMAAGRLSPAVMLDIVARLAPEGAHIASEVHLSTPHFHRALGIENPAQFLSARAGGIGQAFPSAVGAQIAMPDRKVIAVSGDGSALYTPQALWTAAHLKLPITFVVLDNRCYDILAKGMGWYRDARGISTNRPVLHFDLSDPAIDFAAMARAYGVAAATANTPEGFEACLREAIADTAPRLIHALVVPGR